MPISYVRPHRSYLVDVTSVQGIEKNCLAGVVALAQNFIFEIIYEVLFHPV